MKAPAALLVLFLSMGCGAPFSRPTQSEKQYKERYLDMLDAKQIRNLRFTYYGALGTAASIARFATDAAGIESMRAAAEREDAYEPSSEVTCRELRRRFERAAARDLPKWFDVPFTKPLFVFVSQGAGDSDGHRLRLRAPLR
jgi:hypothetical protein